MKVKDLIVELQSCDPEALIVMSSDAEGNMYAPLAEFSDAYMYVPESPYWGEIFLRELTPELESEGYSEEDIYEGSEDSWPCVVFWPVN
jgi:hypothetical protein